MSQSCGTGLEGQCYRHKAETNVEVASVEEPVKLLRGAEYLTDDGKIELLSDGIEQVKKAHAAGRNVLVEVDGREVLLEASASPPCRWG